MSKAQVYLQPCHILIYTLYFIEVKIEILDITFYQWMKHDFTFLCSRAVVSWSIYWSLCSHVTKISLAEHLHILI